jgi:glycosyltransferase involved in cell wall biosynthesis
MSNQLDISVVCPIYNSRDTLSTFIATLREVLAHSGHTYEVVLVNDGCPYNSWEAIENQCSLDKHIKGVRLSRNFGQQIAVSAGLTFTSGRYVIVMDADLQNPPDVIPVIIEKLNEGVDIVYTVSKIRNNWIDELTSSMFWFIMNRVLSTNMIPNQLMMRGFNRKFLSVYNSYSERIRIVAGITHDIGMREAVLFVKNDRRKIGRGNYSFFKRLNLMIDIVLATTSRPLDLLINSSLLSLLLSFLIACNTIISYFLYPDAPAGYATLVTLITFFGSMTLLILGIIGRYLSNIYIEVRQRPLFIVQDKINL